MRSSFTNVPDQAIWRTSASVVNKPESASNPKNKKTAKENPVAKPICLKVKDKIKLPKLEIKGKSISKKRTSSFYKPLEHCKSLCVLVGNSLGSN